MDQQIVLPHVKPPLLKINKGIIKVSTLSQLQRILSLNSIISQNVLLQSPTNYHSGGHYDGAMNEQALLRKT